MRKIVIEKEIYTFDELSEEAKERVLEDWRYSDCLAWQTEYYDTVQEIASQMLWRYDVYSYDGITYKVSFDIDDNDCADLKGIRAWAYIENNYIYKVQEPKTYWLYKAIYCDGRKNWKRKSRIWFSIDDCPFTGFCADCCFSNAWREWKENFTLNSTVEDFVDLVARKLSKEWTADNEYQVSDEGIKEIIEANDYEFTADGKIYNGI